MSTKLHSERKHSKFSASGAERWFNCSGSVAISEGLPDTTNAASSEGTLAHEHLERAVKLLREGKPWPRPRGIDYEMYMHVKLSAEWIVRQWKKMYYSELRLETRIHLKFIHPEMFGTFDASVMAHFDRLDVIDFKYGKYPVDPRDNLQMIFYALGLAHQYDWNFKTVRVWIIQPRAPRFDWESSGPSFWELSIDQLRTYIPIFKAAVRRVEKSPKSYAEGSWCFFCRANKICPLKTGKRDEDARKLF